MQQTEKMKRGGEDYSKSKRKHQTERASANPVCLYSHLRVTFNRKFWKTASSLLVDEEYYIKKIYAHSEEMFQKMHYSNKLNPSTESNQMTC